MGVRQLYDRDLQERARQRAESRLLTDTTQFDERRAHVARIFSLLLANRRQTGPNREFSSRYFQPIPIRPETIGTHSEKLYAQPEIEPPNAGFKRYGLLLAIPHPRVDPLTMTGFFHRENSHYVSSVSFREPDEEHPPTVWMLNSLDRFFTVLLDVACDAEVILPEERERLLQL